METTRKVRSRAYGQVMEYTIYGNSYIVLGWTERQVFRSTTEWVAHNRQNQASLPHQTHRAAVSWLVSQYSLYEAARLHEREQRRLQPVPAQIPAPKLIEVEPRLPQLTARQLKIVRIRESEAEWNGGEGPPTYEWKSYLKGALPTPICSGCGELLLSGFKADRAEHVSDVVNPGPVKGGWDWGTTQLEFSPCCGKLCNLATKEGIVLNPKLELTPVGNPEFRFGRRFLGYNLEGHYVTRAG